MTEDGMEYTGMAGEVRDDCLTTYEEVRKAVKAEREACARIAKEWTLYNRVDGASLPDWSIGTIAEHVSDRIAEAISTRST